MHMYMCIKECLIKIIWKWYEVKFGLVILFTLTRGCSKVIYELKNMEDFLLVIKVLCVFVMVLGTSLVMVKALLHFL